MTGLPTYIIDESVYDAYTEYENKYSFVFAAMIARNSEDTLTMTHPVLSGDLRTTVFAFKEFPHDFFVSM